MFIPKIRTVVIIPEVPIKNGTKQSGIKRIDHKNADNPILFDSNNPLYRPLFVSISPPIACVTSKCGGGGLEL